MKLLTKELEKRFKKIGSQEQSKDPIVIVKFFNPTGAEIWYATEYDSEEKLFFGYVSIFRDHNDEWGYFSLGELEDYKGFGGLGIERDLYCGEKKISEFNIKTLCCNNEHVALKEQQTHKENKKVLNDFFCKL